MNFQLRSLAAAFRPKSRPDEADERAPKPRLQTKPPSGWSQAWQTCRRKAAHFHLRPRRFSTSSTSFSPKPASREDTPSSLSSAESMAKPVLHVQCEARPTLEPVTSTPSVSATSDDDMLLDRETPPGQVVYRRPTVAAYHQVQEAGPNTPGRLTERPLEREEGKMQGGVLAHSPTAVSATSDYDTPAVDDGSCYGSFTSDRRRVVESYLELQAVTERSFVDRW